MKHRTTRDEGAPPKTVPLYASKILELRNAYGLTQLQFAGELKAARISVARWETVARLPGKQNYLALAEMAARKGLQPLSDFFSSQIEAKLRSKQKKIEERDALHSLREIRQREDAGDQEAARLLGLAAVEPAQYAKEQLAEIMKARQELQNGEFSIRLSEIANQASRVSQLRLGLEVKARREMEAIDREIDKLLARKKEAHGANTVLRREISQLSLAWKEAKQEGPDLVEDVSGTVRSWAREIEWKLSQLKKG